MYIPNPYFTNIPQIGNLVLEHIFVEDGYPILFICSAKDNKLYLCLCRDTYKIQKWIISEINVDILEKLIHKKISIFDAFKNHAGKAVLAFWSRQDGETERFKVLSSCKEIASGDLPEKDFYYLDDGESESYLQQVKNRIRNEEFTIIEQRICEGMLVPIELFIERPTKTFAKILVEEKFSIKFIINYSTGFNDQKIRKNNSKVRKQLGESKNNRNDYNNILNNCILSTAS